MIGNHTDDGEGKYGFVSGEGKLVIPLVLDEAEGFEGDLALVTQDNKTGYLNTVGEFIWSINNWTEYASSLRQTILGNNCFFLGNLDPTGDNLLNREVSRHWSAALDLEQAAAIAEKHGASLVLFARQWTPAADDAVQEAFIDLLRLQKPPDNPAAWLFTTVKRKAMNHVRSDSRRQKHTQSFAALRDAWFESNYVDELFAEEVKEFIERLDDIERQILVARVWGDLSFQEIAELVTQSTSSVHRRYQAALHKLAQFSDSSETSQGELPT